MQTSKITQKQLAFYKLYQEKKANAVRYVPTWEFVGEIEVPELGMWGLMSYKCPTRLTDIFQENPGLVERELIVGKSGSKYYGYRIAPHASKDMILDSTLRELHSKIRRV